MLSNPSRAGGRSAFMDSHFPLLPLLFLPLPLSSELPPSLRPSPWPGIVLPPMHQRDLPPPSLMLEHVWAGRSHRGLFLPGEKRQHKTLVSFHFGFTSLSCLFPRKVATSSFYKVQVLARLPGADRPWGSYLITPSSSFLPPPMPTL